MKRFRTTRSARLSGTILPAQVATVVLVTAAAVAGLAAGAHAEPSSREAVYRIELGVSEPTPVNALQLAVAYPADRGHVVGDRADAHCTVDPNFSGYSSFNNCATADGKGCPAAGVVHVALVSLTPFVPSDGLVACDFASAVGRPDAWEFTVQVVDATRTNGGEYLPVAASAHVGRITSSAATAR
jgi:hypothetical protein